MKKIDTKKLLIAAVPTVLVFVSILIFGSKNSDDSLKPMAGHATAISVNPPKDVNFAGEVVPMYDFEVKERLDRELIRNTYYHSATILIIKRSNRWKRVMLPILKEKGVPADFFYLCVAESHLTNAVSPAGARGFWQFMKPTGLNYGLEITNEVDERYNVVKATYAACDYLKDSHRRFKNWTLVAASYNMGVGGVSSQLSRQEVDSYYDLYLNKETSAYVFRILALKSILEDPGKYGFQIPAREMYPTIASNKVVVKDDIPDLVDFAKEYNTTYKMLKVLNPWILRDHLTVEQGKSYVIEIPKMKGISASELIVHGDSVGTDSLNISADSSSADTQAEGN